MKGKILSYRRGVHTEYTNQYVLEIDGVTDRQAAEAMVGKKVIFKTQTGKEIVGKISKAHGNSGAVLARFNKGLPGQAIGAEVTIS
ncbi:MAG: 50S ribosomal protein L35ae [Candidatus Micrarchaeota archaeon]|nr:50S ribosomal protein L35ae [Candidatus Micrarchaeota archaeon]